MNAPPEFCEGAIHLTEESGKISASPESKAHDAVLGGWLD